MTDWNPGAGFPGILLAAGLSQRFGSQKLLIPYGEGLTIFEHTLRSHLEAGIRPLVVVVSREILERFFGGNRGPSRCQVSEQAGQPRLTLETPWGKARAVVNDTPEAGMSTSLKQGLRGLDDNEKREGVLVSLADMPKITPEVIRILVERYRKDRVDMVVPTYRGALGHPVVFREPWYRKDIAEIQGDRGLRDLIRSRRGNILFLPWWDDAVVADVDTPEDLNRIFQEGMMIHGD